MPNSRETVIMARILGIEKLSDPKVAHLGRRAMSAYDRPFDRMGFLRADVRKQIAKGLFGHAMGTIRPLGEEKENLLIAAMLRVDWDYLALRLAHRLRPTVEETICAEDTPRAFTKGGDTAP